MFRTRPMLLTAFLFLLLLQACTSAPATPTAPAPTAASTATLMPILADSETPTAVQLPATNTPVPADTLAPTSTPTPLPTVDPFPTTNPWDGAPVSWIPAGDFIMGADAGSPDFWGAEYPAHTVTLDAFVIYRNEVTNAMYQACVKA